MQPLHMVRGLANHRYKIILYNMCVLSLRARIFVISKFLQLEWSLEGYFSTS